MQIISKILFAAAICFFLSGAPAAAASQPPAVAGSLPDITLAAPQDTELQL